MPDILLITLWGVITLGIAAASILLGKRYTVAYPIAMMAVLMTVANILANKIVVFGAFAVSGGVLVYSATFLITDLLSEIWGKHAARTAVWAGFYGSIFLVVMLWIVSLWPAPEFAAAGAAEFTTALALTPRVVLASLVTYLIVQHHDVWAFHWWKRKTNGRHLWLRNNASTLVSQGLDQLLFVTLAFYGVLPIIPLIIGGYLVKALVAVIDTPFMYGLRWLAERVKPIPTILDR